MGDQEVERPSKKARGSSPPPAISDGLTAFALRLTKKLAEGDDTRARGRTLVQLLALLGAASADEVAGFVRGLAAVPSGSGGPVITYAYGVFHQKHMELTPDFLHTATESYIITLRYAPSTSPRSAQQALNNIFGDRKKIRKEINKWAAAATNNLISEILPERSLSQLSRFVLTNAVYFKGVWETRFPEKLTEKREFHRLGDADPDHVPFMTLPGECKLFASHRKGFKVLKLPYKAGDSSATPATMSCATLAKVGGSLLDHVPKHRSRVRKLMLPKFKMSFFCRLANVLRGLGLRDAFSENADLSGLVRKTADCDVRLDEVFHKPVLEVNEEGTVAAACTAVTGRVKQTARRPLTLEFIADHPFAFYIVEEVSGAVVFAGHVLDPSSSQ
ncbi:hypothetical protein VPH35_047946 [Triticum aestivum]